MPDHVKMIRALGVVRFGRKLEWSVGQQHMITMCDAPALAGPAVQVFQFDSQDSALNPFHPVIESDFVVIIPLSRAMLAQGARPCGECGVIRHQRPTFAISAKILSGIKTEA